MARRGSRQSDNGQGASAGPVGRVEYSRSAATRESIVAAAVAVSVEVGLSNASVAAIAERAGVALGNIYYHFGSKDQLLACVPEKVWDFMVERTRPVPLVSGGDFFAQEERAFRALLEFLRTTPEYIRLAQEAKFVFPDVARKLLERSLRLIQDSLHYAMGRGEVRVMERDEVVALSHMILGARSLMNELYDGLDGFSWPGDEIVLATYMNLIRSGLRPPLTIVST